VPRSLMLRVITALLALAAIASACGSDDDSAGADRATGDEFSGTLMIGAIPDQDGEILARNYGKLADYLSAELGIDVEFQPVTEYDGAVTAFKVGDLDLVWFGGLTGVQARLEVEGADAIAQRNIDAEFTSVFIAGTDTGLEPVDDIAGLAELEGRRFTFGSESSTSGRLMPQSFLSQAGLDLDSFDGEPGFSGSHDQTIALVEAGTFEAGVLNSQVWAARLADGAFDASKVQVIFETPPYYDYHWVARPEIDPALRQAIVDALVGLDPAVPEEAEILSFFGAESFITTESSNYDQIEAVGREIGKITE
jgi:phosphonate transport system substrate-binding protein